MQDGMTVALIAPKKGSEAMLRMAIEAGCDVNAKDKASAEGAGGGYRKGSDEG